MEVKEIRQTKTKAETDDFLKNGGLSHIPITYCGCEGFFVPIGNSKNKGIYPEITITMCNKDICKIYPHEILYIAIEDRKTVVYLKDKRVETRYTMEYWDNLLETKAFAHPHKSFLVNLNYVYEVNNDFVKLRCGNCIYSVYTSQRKIKSFRKAVLNYNKDEE